jgi:hypothetical protein
MPKRKTSGRTTIIYQNTKFAERLAEIEKRYPDLSRNKIIQVFANKGSEYFTKDNEAEFLAEASGRK